MDKDNIENNYRTGYIAIIGRPNVGKSTLLNHILGMHLSITSKKPQTTRHRLLGIKTTSSFQAIYVDTPGLHQGRKGAMHRFMNKEATMMLNGVDVIVFMVDALKWTEEDSHVLKLLGNQFEHDSIPILLVVNKVDRVADKTRLLPYLEELSKKSPFSQIVPISASNGKNIDKLETSIVSYLNLSPAYYNEEQLTDKSDRFLAAELIREQLMRLLGQELPYASTVEIEAFEESQKIIKISALIWVERANQKSIIIGEKGLQLKEIGTNARRAMQTLFGKKILVKLWVKVKTGWSNDERALRSLGYVNNQD
ncbi:MAG: GTPase Era [Pseudomonadota bacterium]